jgi:cobalt/nickel transport system permease protein
MWHGTRLRCTVQSVHLADGIVTQTPLVIGLNVAGALGAAWALRMALRGGRSRLAYTGTLAAFVLAAQAINVPLLPGASAHVIGTTLLTLTVGPALAISAMLSVLLVQALAFADGGLTVLGVNVVNMALLPALAVVGVRRVLPNTARGLKLTAILGTVLGALLAAFALTCVLVDGAGAPTQLTAGWLLGVQGLAGLAEGVLTAVAVGRLGRYAPELLLLPATVEAQAPLALDDPAAPAPTRRYGLRVVMIAVAVTLVLTPFAADVPDALEVVVEHLNGAR